MGNRPNIFEFATKELSQDAFIAWLLAWSDEKYKKEDSELHKLGKDLLKAMCGDGWKLGELIEGVSPVKTQWKNIDILVSLENKIREKAYLIIEDKIGAKLYNDLQSYKNKVVTFFGETEIKGVYLKTGNFTPPKDFSAELKNIGFVEFYRKDLLKILETYKGENQIVIDFRTHWQEVEEETNSFEDRKVSEWTPLAWEGFCDFLTREAPLNYGMSWDYTNNAKKGNFIWCSWLWKSLSNENVKLYLQLDSKDATLEFRIGFWGEEAKKISKNDRLKLQKEAEEFLDTRLSELNRSEKIMVGKGSCRIRYVKLSEDMTYNELESFLLDISKKLEI